MKRSTRWFIFAVVAVLFAVPGSAQDVVGGVISSNVNFGQIGGYTILNLETPFNTEGQLTSFSAQFAFFGGATACAAGDSFKVRVFRPNTGNAYQLIAERGPFSDVVGTVTVALSPAIAVHRGDFLAVALLGPGQCGLTGFYGSQNHLVQINGDYTAGAPSFFVDVPGSTMNFRASSGAVALVGTLPGAGVTGGASGSSFNTSFSITNPTSDAVTVTFVWRPAGAGDGTPVVSALTVPGGSSKAPKLTDLFAVNGIGSIDVYSNTATPIVNARVYNDTGSGTNGFTEPLVAPTATAHEFDRIWLTIPSDLSAFRMNIGVRALTNGATFGCTVYSPSGVAVSGVSKSYAANATSLEPLQSFFGNDPRALAAGGSIVCTPSVSVKSDLILYGTVTDNRTNDSAMYLAERH